MNTNNYPKKVYLGHYDGERIYLSAPSWDCGWYWGFGYLGNDNRHYHVSGLSKDTDLKTGFDNHFGDSFIVRPSMRWTFAELFQSFYDLQRTAKILGRGGSHLSMNPAREVIKDEGAVKRINEKVLPEIFKEIYKILYACQEDKALFDLFKKLNIEGSTDALIDFMFENKLKPEDIKYLDTITDDDYHRVHGEFFKAIRR